MNQLLTKKDSPTNSPCNNTTVVPALSSPKPSESSDTRSCRRTYRIWNLTGSENKPLIKTRSAYSCSSWTTASTEDFDNNYLLWSSINHRDGLLQVEKPSPIENTKENSIVITRTQNRLDTRIHQERGRAMSCGWCGGFARRTTTKWRYIGNGFGIRFGVCGW